MTKILLKILTAIIVVFCVYFYFGEYGNLQLKTANYLINTSVSFVAATIVILVIFVIYIASILRFVIDIPSRLFSYFSEMRERKARELLIDIMFLKVARRPFKAFELFQKNRKKLQNQDQKLFKLLDFTFNKSSFNEVELVDKFIDLSKNSANGEIIWQEFILPNYQRENISELEKFLTELQVKKIKTPVYELAQIYIFMHQAEYDQARKMHKKAVSSEVLSEQSLASVETEILCSKAFALIEDGKKKEATKILYEAFSISLDSQIIHSLRRLPSKEVDKQKYNKLIESEWKKRPNNDLINCYLEINGGDSQGKMLSLIETLLDINGGKAALIAAATEYYILGYEKQADLLLKDINPEEFTSPLNKAMIFRKALSTEAKSEKLSIFRELIFDRYDY